MEIDKITRFSVVVFVFTVCSVQCFSLPTDVAPGWHDKKADIYFAVDSSSSIWLMDYRVMLTFVSDLVQLMDIGSTKTRVGVGLFSKKHIVFMPLNNNRSKDSLVKAIQDAPYVPGNGYISKAIEGIRKEGLSPKVTRKGVPLISVLFTDGSSRHAQLALDNSTLAKREGIYMYTIGIGKDVDKEQLMNIASDPKNDFAYWIPYFSSGYFNTIKSQLLKSMSDVEVLQKDEGTCGKKEDADVLFVYDEYAMGQSNSLQVKEFIKSVVTDLRMDSGSIRVGVYSKTCHKGDITLGQYVKRDNFFANIDKKDDTPGISSLVKTARVSGFLPDVGGRGHARKRIVIFLHGEVSEHHSVRLMDEAMRAKFNQIEIFLIQINTDLKKGVSQQIASRNSYIFHTDSMNDLSLEKEDFLLSFCSELN